MPEVSKLSLNAGELSDEIAGRIDLSKFNMGCEVLENAKVLRAGGVTRRSGFEYLGATEDATGKSRLVGFRFSENQGFCLEFSDLTLRVHTAGAINATTYVTPWLEADLFDLQFAQRIDRIVVTHPDHPVQNILKYADGTWGVVEHPWVERIWEPYPSTTDFTMTAAATTGSTTITADSAIFLVSPTWVGDRLQLVHTVDEATEEYLVTSATNPSVLFVSASGVYAADSVIHEVTSGRNDYYQVIAPYDGAGGTGTGPDDDTATDVPHYITTAPNSPFFSQGAILVPPTEVTAGWVFETFGLWNGTYWVQRSYDGGTTWSTIKVISSEQNKNERLVETETETAHIRVLVPRFAATGGERVEFTVSSYDAKGSAVITSRVSDTVVNVTVEEEIYSTEETSVWNECAFSPRNGYPVAATFYQGRLALGGTTTRPQTFWLSRTQKPFDFTLGTLATDAMSFQTDAEGYEAISWLSSHLSLLVGTTLGVWAVKSPDGSPLTPESNSIHRQMQLGAQKGFQAVPLQNNILFLQYKGRKIQELTGGSVEYGGYLSADMTQLATHVTRGGITQLAGGELPDSVLYAVNGTELAMLTYERAQNVVGWSRWITNGEFESIATTAGASEDDDHYVIINRDGVNDRYIGYLAPDMLRVEEDNDVPNLRFLDNYTERIEVTPFTTISGLSRFEGEQVDTFIDGEPYGLVTVTGGVATLPHAGLNAIVGEPYTTEVRPMSIDFGSIGSKSSIIDVIIRFRNSLGGEVSQDRVRWSKVQQLQPRITTDVPLSLLSQDFQSTPHSTWLRRPSISVRQTQPLPMTVLAMRLKTKTSK